jgi:hypothetical protein
MPLAEVVAALSEAATRVHVNEPRDFSDQLSIAHHPVHRRRVPRRARQPDACTGPVQRPRGDLDKKPQRLALARRP